VLSVAFIIATPANSLSEGPLLIIAPSLRRHVSHNLKLRSFHDAEQVLPALAHFPILDFGGFDTYPSIL
jgi:hypothetical protein